MNSNITLCVGTLFRPINDWECYISRLGGSVIIFISFLSILFNIRYIYWSCHHRKYCSDHYLFILSMIFSSLLVTIIIIPLTTLQCLTCTRLCSRFYCQFEGFISYLNGCVYMFMLMMISIIRYNLVLHTNTRKEYFQKYSYVFVIICWIFALIFAVPPLFNWNKYTPEGLGFHCGLNWLDRSRNSRIYFILAFLFVYFIPLIVLSIINIYVYRVIHCLLHRTSKQSMRTNLLEVNQQPSSINLSTSSSINSNKLKIIDLSKTIMINNKRNSKFRRTTDPVHMRYIMRLNRLKIDQRFALATIGLVSEYLLSWTPYACIALLYLFNIKFIIEQPVFITICAFIAKISMIINPFIYILIIKNNQMKIILFQKKCFCQHCK